MNNSDVFQSMIDQTDLIVGVDSTEDGSIGLYHILAFALDWCDTRGVNFDETLQDLRSDIALDRSKA